MELQPTCELRGKAVARRDSHKISICLKSVWIFTGSESNTGMFGGNSNWRGAGLDARQLTYRPRTVERLCLPWGRLHRRVSNRLRQSDDPVRSRPGDHAAARRIFLRDEGGRRPFYGRTAKFQEDP